MYQRLKMLSIVFCAQEALLNNQIKTRCFVLLRDCNPICEKEKSKRVPL